MYLTQSIVFLAQAELMPVRMGTPGTIFMFLYSGVITVGAIYLWWKRNEIEAVRRECARWEGANKSNESIVKSQTLTIERIEAEKQALERRVGEAEAKTDLRPLFEQYQRIAEQFQRVIEQHQAFAEQYQRFAEHHQAFADQFQIEVRENQEVHVRIVERLDQVDDRTREILEAIRQSIEVTRLNIEVTQGVQRTTNSLVELMAGKFLLLLDRLTAEVSAGGATGLRIEKHGAGVARDLAASHQRANDTVSDEAGAAADAAMRPEEKEKLDG